MNSGKRLGISCRILRALSTASVLIFGFSTSVPAQAAGASIGASHLGYRVATHSTNSRAKSLQIDPRAETQRAGSRADSLLTNPRAASNSVQGTELGSQTFKKNQSVQVAGRGNMVVVYASDLRSEFYQGRAHRSAKYAAWKKWTFVDLVPDPVRNLSCFSYITVWYPPGGVAVAPYVPTFRDCPQPRPPGEVGEPASFTDLIGEAFENLLLPFPRPVAAVPSQAITGMPISIQVNVPPLREELVTILGEPVQLNLRSTFEVDAGDGSPTSVEPFGFDTPRGSQSSPNQPAQIIKHMFQRTGPKNDPTRGSVDISVTQRWIGTWDAPTRNMSGVVDGELVLVNDVDLAAYQVSSYESVRIGVR